MLLVRQDSSLHEPVFNGNEWRYLKECLDSTYVSSVGKFVDKFEQGLVELTGAKYAIALVNGTAAIHLALRISGMLGKRMMLCLAPHFYFCRLQQIRISYVKAIPHFIDNDQDTLGVDPIKLYEYLNKFTNQLVGQCIRCKNK